jgi:D-amino peptidase
MMKVYITFDMEGVSGVVAGMTGPNPNSPAAYRRGQRFSTDDVAAAVNGILEVDPDAEIWFNDAHGRSMNVFYEEFPENVSIVANSAELFDEVLAIDGRFDAMIGIGEHANPETANGVLQHVWDVRTIKFNDVSLAEITLDAALAGYYKVPTVMVSGDEATCEYVKNVISPKIATVAVKRGIGKRSAVCLHPKKAQRLIKAAVIDGLKRRNEIPPLTFTNPVTVDITYKDGGGADTTSFFMQNYPDERISADTVRFVAPNAKEAYFGFLARDKLGKPKSGRGY